jgi:hypothetical protein
MSYTALLHVSRWQWTLRPAMHVTFRAVTLGRSCSNIAAALSRVLV